MGGYTIGDVCRLLQVRAHVLRYWEREIPILSPRKDDFGRRVYTEADIEILFRIRHLLHDRKLTVAGVRKRIWEDMSDDHQNQRARLLAVRSELVRATRISQRLLKLLSEKDRPKRTDG